ncbi:MAG: hypothetical protein AAF363_09175 [Bacteroidota bacterium]
MNLIIRSIYILLLLLLTYSCASYYELNYEFNRSFENGNLQQADEVLADNKKAKKGKNRLLYYMNRGVANSLLGDYNESNRLLEKAYIIAEDLQTNYLQEAFSYLSNPGFVTYKGEDHEILFIHYYKALNFMKLNDFDDALVEVRRMDIKIRELQTKYKSDSKYQDDAFIHLLMGLVYDASKDYNNAFIAYRNSYNVYKDYYKENFNLDAPEQLKFDLLRTAYLTGFYDEVAYYEKEFDKKYDHVPGDGTEVLLFWNNGLGPVKSQWSINFAAVKGAGGAIVFENAEYGYSFPFIWGDHRDQNENVGFDDISVTRVAFPKYVERPPLFNDATVNFKGSEYPLELAENVNGVAFKVLQQRFLLEMGKSLIRVAIKKAAEKKLRDENEALGTVLSLVNAASEKADTRNWQTIPHSIYYTRVPMEVEGKDQKKLYLKLNSAKGKQYNQVNEINIEVKQGETAVHTFHSLEISPDYNGISRF